MKKIIIAVAVILCVLNNNTGYSRSVIGSNISESNRFVIKRYWLLTATWNFTKNLKL